jgi:hypothetical protein
MRRADFPPDFLAAIESAVLARDGTPERNEIRFRCPGEGHPDEHPSARWNREKAAWRCDACRAGGGALDLADRLGIERPRRRGGGGDFPSGITRNTATPPGGCTLAAYANAKRIPVEALQAFGLTEMTYNNAPAVRIPYPDEAGGEAAVRFRVALAKAPGADNRFRWRKGDKTCLYGRDRRHAATERGYAVLVEGESDCHTLWHHGEPAFGIPGAGTWNERRDAATFDGIETVYVVEEPDAGGGALVDALAASALRSRVRLVRLGEHADPSGLYLADPEAFSDRWQAALAAAVSLSDELAAAAKAATAEAWAACAGLATKPDILAIVAQVLAAAGVAGEARTLKLLYLILVSRFLPRPASAAIKGPSSGGKSYALERVLDLFPDDAYYALSAMSERALAYGTEPLKHRFLVLYEAAGMAGEMATYLIRSLLSEGRVRYETVEHTKDGLVPRLIEREGPTGLLLTTTAVRLHPENETRMLSIPVTDTPDQTRDVFLALAAEGAEQIDPKPWHALQSWLAAADHAVTIPYAGPLSQLMPPLAVRLRRDFGAVLVLIRAHAILHQATRERDGGGRIVATLADYGAVRELVGDLIAEGVEATVPAPVRETVEVVRRIVTPAHNVAGGESLVAKVRDHEERTATVTEIAKALKIDKSAASRRVRVATERGYLKNLEDRKGRPARIALGEPVPENVELLPTVEAIHDRCSVAADPTGETTPSPPGGPACLGCGALLPPGRNYQCGACAAKEAA